ncbi:MAG: hypothetical protein AAGD13_25385 [Pseudomonadota bacterium]
MVAYSFKTAFVTLVHELKKTQTIRAHRKRHARVGEPVQLFNDLRRKTCIKLVDPDPICIASDPIEIWVRPGFDCLYRFPEIQEAFDPVDDAFAYADGFLNAAHFAQFWRKTHGLGLFEGKMIKWDPTRRIESHQ